MRLPPSGTWGQRSAELQLRTILRGSLSSKSPNRISWGFGCRYLLSQFPLPHSLICISPEVTPHWTFFIQLSIRVRLPRWLSGKESACNARDMGSIPGSGRSPRGGLGNLLQYPCLKNSMDRWAWMAIVQRITKSPTRLSDWTTTLGKGAFHSPGHSLILDSGRCLGCSMNRCLELCFCWETLYVCVCVWVNVYIIPSQQYLSFQP